MLAICFSLTNATVAKISVNQAVNAHTQVIALLCTKITRKRIINNKTPKHLKKELIANKRSVQCANGFADRQTLQQSGNINTVTCIHNYSSVSSSIIGTHRVVQKKLHKVNDTIILQPYVRVMWFLARRSERNFLRD